MNFKSRTIRGALVAVTVALSVASVPAAGGAADAGKQGQARHPQGDSQARTFPVGCADRAGTPLSHVRGSSARARVCRVATVHNIPAAPAIEGATHLHSGKVRDLYRLDRRRTC